MLELMAGQTRLARKQRKRNDQHQAVQAESANGNEQVHGRLAAVRTGPGRLFCGIRDDLGKYDRIAGLEFRATELD